MELLAAQSSVMPCAVSRLVRAFGAAGAVMSSTMNASTVRLRPTDFAFFLPVRTTFSVWARLRSPDALYTTCWYLLVALYRSTVFTFTPSR